MFRNGARIAQPTPLPKEMVGKTLFPMVRGLGADAEGHEGVLFCVVKGCEGFFRVLQGSPVQLARCSLLPRQLATVA